jgi:hypothetical protein
MTLPLCGWRLIKLEGIDPIVPTKQASQVHFLRNFVRGQKKDYKDVEDEILGATSEFCIQTL